MRRFDLTEESVADEAARMDAALAEASLAGAEFGAFDAALKSPFDLLAEAEEEMERARRAGDGLKEAVEGAHRQGMVEGFREFLRFVFGSGAHPMDVAGRCYSLAQHQDPRLIGGMTQEQMAAVLGDKNRKAVNARYRTQIGELERANGTRRRAPHQKSADHAARCARVQRGNTNRARGAAKLAGKAGKVKGAGGKD